MIDSVNQLASSPVVWTIAILVISIVIIQGIIFMNLSKSVAPKVGLSNDDVKTAIRTGFISSIGPSLGVAIVIISLITLIGSPLTMLRIGIIGSAATETAAAGIGATAFGVDLGSPDFGLKAFVTVVWTMCIGGLGWLIFTVLFTKSLGNIEAKVRKKNPKLIGIISLAAMLGAFGYLTGEQMIQSISFGFATLASIITMVVLMKFAENKNINWLKEWALGISMLLGMVAGSLANVF